MVRVSKKEFFDFIGNKDVQLWCDYNGAFPCRTTYKVGSKVIGYVVEFKLSENEYFIWEQ